MPLHVLHYDIDLTLLPVPPDSPIADAPGRIDARCALRLRNDGRRPVRHVRLMLYRLLDVSSAETDGRLVAFRQVQRRIALDWTDALFVNRVTLTLEKAIEPGAEVAVALRYGGTLVGYRELGAYMHDSVQRDVAVLRPEVLWYPVPGPLSWQGFLHAWSRAPFTVSAHCPARWDCFVAGALKSLPSDAPLAFESTGSASTPGIHLYAGRYEARRDGPVAVHYLPGGETWTRTAAAAGTSALGELERLLGAPPVGNGEATFVAIPPGWGSQNLFDIITQTAEEDPAQTFREVAHEVSHFWTPIAEGDPDRFAEAIAHFFEDYLEGLREGPSAVDAAIAAHMATLRQRPEAAKAPLAGAGMHPDIETISRQKGPLALWALARAIGVPKTMEALSTWAHTKGGGADEFAALLLARFGDEKGFNASHFVDDWFHAGFCPLDLDLAPETALRQLATRYLAGQP